MNRQNPLIGSFILLALLLAGCTTAAPKNLASAKVPSCTSGAPALYTARDDDTTVHLFGTVHLLRPETAWRNPSFTQAWHAADTVVFEANVDSAEAQQKVAALIGEHGVFGAEDSLYKHINQAQSDQLLDIAKDLGIPGQAFAPMKPWMVSIQISIQHLIRSGYAPGAGVESVLAAEAKTLGKTRRYLESLEDQILAMSSLPMTDQLAMLDATLKAMSEDPDGLDRLVDSWSLGDQQALADEFVDVDALGSREVYNALIVRRNKNWVPDIRALMEQPGVKFIAVGAGHLVGDDSVLAMLADQGFELSCQ